MRKENPAVSNVANRTLVTGNDGRGVVRECSAGLLDLELSDASREGKAAVQAAAHKTIRKAAPATVVLAYNPSDGPYEDDDDGPDDDGPYVDGLYVDDDLDENGYLIW
jgi:hypothetical protein